MRLKRWLMGILAVVSVGMLQVAQHNTVYLKGYALGDRVEKAHKEQTDVSWLQARVVGLTSPEHLSGMAQKRHLDLVAWSMLSPEKGPRAVFAARPAEKDSAAAVSQLPPQAAVQLADVRDTTD